MRTTRIARDATAHHRSSLQPYVRWGSWLACQSTEAFMFVNSSRIGLSLRAEDLAVAFVSVTPPRHAGRA